MFGADEGTKYRRNQSHEKRLDVRVRTVVGHIVMRTKNCDYDEIVDGDDEGEEVGGF